MVHDDDAVGDLEGLLLVVGDEDARDADLIVEASQPAPQLLPDLGVEGPEGLVEQEDPRLDGEGPGQGDTLALPSRELRRESGRFSQSSCTSSSSSITLRRISPSAGRRVRGRTRSPKATFSNTDMCRKSA